MGLTDLQLRSLPRPEKGQQCIWDTSLPGFGVRVSQGGAKTFLLKHRNQFITLGRYHPDILPLAKARDAAKRMLAEFTLGKIRPQSITYAQAVELFLDDKARAKKTRTVADYKRLLNRLPYKGQLSELNHAEALRLLKRFKAPSEREHLRVALKVLFNWCRKRRYITENPVDGLAPARTKRRTRILADQELKAVWTTCQKDNEIPLPFKRIVQLLILTGQRRGEIAGLRTSFIDADTVALPPELVKNNRAHTFPVPALVMDILRAIEVAEGNDALFFPARGKPDKPFNGWGKAKELLDELSGVTAWRLHDLRRTFRSNLGRLGVAPYIAERLVNHISSQTEMEQVYDQYRYMPEMRDAMNKWEEHLTAVTAQN